ncbi:hypothetical protein [Streptomyces sp. NBC_00154]|uniref:hypothetical protein n=1 Tax=Streptomyces sp. NBC_00154 TaxID=2975670 RepID=UPI0022521696|nr:hypothetical protein [Streptomyces sp. NBC_00154]MCX5318021.1 hypothetical protein [Streptomyces sp. NBC_00154]
MGRISDTDRSRNEEAIRAAMDRLLRGELPPGGRCDLKTLAADAGVTRTGFYPKRDRDGSVREGPYQHLGDEFVRRLAAHREAGEAPDPRDAQIERLKAQNAELKDRVTERDATIEELTEFKKLALSRLAAQHDEITHLRSPQPSPEPLPPAKLATVPRTRTTAIGTCS